MRLLLSIAAIALLSGILGVLLPWWSVGLAAFIVSLFSGLRGFKSFIAGLLGASLCWFSIVLVRDLVNNHVLSTRMATLFHLSGNYSFMAVTIALGGLVGGLAALAASFFRRPTI